VVAFETLADVPPLRVVVGVQVIVGAIGAITNVTDVEVAA
jgi:hypothetical protein